MPSRTRPFDLILAAALVPACVQEHDHDDIQDRDRALNESEAQPSAQRQRLIAAEPPVDTTTAGDEDFDDDPPSEGEADVLASLDLTGEVEVIFTAADSESIGIAVGGPIGSSGVDAALATVACAASPADAFATLAGEDEDLPAALAEHSDTVLASNNWNPPQGCESPNMDGGHLITTDETVPSTDPNAPTDTLVNDGVSLENPCGAAHSSSNSSTSHPLHANHGNCNIYNRSLYGTTTWQYNDILAFVGHVIVTNGVVHWQVQKQNCNACSWNIVYSQAIAQGYHYYYYNNAITNDYNNHSQVTCIHGSGCSHLHDVARCHDWQQRAVWTSGAAGGCRTRWNGSTLFCSPTAYVGADPSIIHTPTSWDGNGSGWPHC